MFCQSKQTADMHIMIHVWLQQEKALQQRRACRTEPPHTLSQQDKDTVVTLSSCERFQPTVALFESDSLLPWQPKWREDGI